MQKAYYVINMRDVWGEWYEGTYIPPKGTPFLPKVALQHRLDALRQHGSILARRERYELQEGLVGWMNYVILTFGKCTHWKEHIHQETLFGFIFNAEKLLNAGALFAVENLVTEYEQIILEAVKRVASTLPPGPGLSDEMLDIMMKHSVIGDHPFLREHYKKRGMNPLPDLWRALETQNLEFPGCQEVLNEVHTRVQCVNAQKLLHGSSAITYLTTAPDDGSCQILVRDRLSLDQAIGMIQGGEEIFL